VVGIIPKQLEMFSSLVLRTHKLDFQKPHYHIVTGFITGHRVLRKRKILSQGSSVATDKVSFWNVVVSQESRKIFIKSNSISHKKRRKQKIFVRSDPKKPKPLTHILHCTTCHPPDAAHDSNGNPYKNQQASRTEHSTFHNNQGTSRDANQKNPPIIPKRPRVLI
jgi:hypothetical protein